MLFEGKAIIGFFAECGWEDKWTVDFSLKCNKPENLEDAIKNEYHNMGKNVYFQTGCEHNCLITVWIKKCYPLK